MMWRGVGVMLFAIGLVAAWRPSIDFDDPTGQTHVIIEAVVMIIGAGLGARLMFPTRWFR